MAEYAASLASAPTHTRPAQQSMKEAPIQILKHNIEVVDAPLGRMQPLASAQLPHQVSLTHHFMAGNIFSITRRVATINGLAVHLGQQDMGNRADNPLRRAFEQIGKPYQKPALAQANRIVDVGESKELDLQFRRHGAGTQLPVLIMKDFKKSRTHNATRLARTDP